MGGATGIRGGRRKRIFQVTNAGIAMLRSMKEAIQLPVLGYQVHTLFKESNYDELERLAEKERPKLIIGGGSAYPRIIDFERMGQIAREVGAYLLADIAHVAEDVAHGVLRTCRTKMRADTAENGGGEFHIVVGDRQAADRSL